MALISVLLANIWIGIPFNLVILYSGLQNIPEDLYEAAALDGANAWQIFRRITFPLLRPVSAIVLLLGLVYTLKVFDIIWIMTKGGPAGSSTTLATWTYQLGFGSLLPDFGPAAAVGNILIGLAWWPDSSTSGCSAGRSHDENPPQPARTVIGLGLTAIMLFPVYWMLNVSLTKDTDMRKSPPDLIPIHPTLVATAPSWISSCPIWAPVS